MSAVEIVKEWPAPFLPGTNIQYAWDSTSLGWFKRCPRLYYYSMIEGWIPNEESVHLRFGIEYHRALQDYDLSRAAGISHADAVHDVVRELLLRTDDWRPDHKYKNRDFLVRTVIWYLEKYPAEEDPAETHIMNDGRPAVEVSFRFELDWGPTPGQPYLLCGHIDKVVRFNDDLYAKDYKTTTSTPGSYYWDQFEPDNQMTLYTLATLVIFQTPIKGVIIDAAQIAIEWSRFTRGVTYRSKEQLEEWVKDLNHHLDEAEKCATKGYWPQRDTSCGLYGGCRFRKICSKSPVVREQFLKSDFTKGDPWNPLQPR